MIEEKLIKKAQWSYYHFIKKNDCPFVELDFEKHFANSWEQFNQYAISDKKTPEDFTLNNATLYLCWHFPEYPLLLKSVAKSDMLILVADNSEWIINSISEEKIYNFRESNFKSKLIHSFKKRIPIICMFDYYYSSSKYIISNFLGYPSKTPYGVIKLALLFEYSISLITDKKETSIIPVNEIDLNSLQKTIDFINKKIETSILEIPSRWLLWPSIDNRWQNVDYEL